MRTYSSISPDENDLPGRRSEVIVCKISFLKVSAEMLYPPIILAVRAQIEHMLIERTKTEIPQAVEQYMSQVKGDHCQLRF